MQLIRDRVAALVAQGKSEEDVVAAKPTAEWDEVWGNGFLKPDRFTRIVFTSVTRTSAAGHAHQH